jgi:ABC-2 type transport system permease protein
MRLIRSEFLKIRTTNVWWLFALGAFGLLLLSFLINAVNMHMVLNPPQQTGLDPAEQAQLAAMTAPKVMTSYLATSGQYFGLMFVMLLGIITVTNEFHHQTATTTFLTTPHRTAVVVAKAVAAAIFGLIIFLITTAITLPATAIFMNAEGVTPALGEWSVIRAILLNLLAYGLWALIGVGIGILVRSQIGATVTALVLYLVGTAAVAIVASLLARWLEASWIEDLSWGMPSLASGLMVSGDNIAGQPQYWIGAIILIGWAAVTGVIGTLITRTRDIA